jgi:hypothetical protein
VPLFFCGKVSRIWGRYLGNSCFAGNAHVGNILTISDEAYALWFVKHKYKTEQKIADKIIECGEDADKYHEWWKQYKKNVCKGSRLSTAQYHDYTALHKLISAHRKDEKARKHWDDMFFHQLFEYVKKMEGKIEARGTLPVHIAFQPSQQAGGTVEADEIEEV